MPSIILSGKNFNYDIQKRSISSIRLRLKTSHSFIISCPILTPNFVIQSFIKHHQDWILKNSTKIHSKKSIFRLKTIKILGNDYQIIFTKTQRDSVVFSENEQKIYANISQNSKTFLKKVLETKFRPFALSLIKKELANLSRQFGFDYHHVSVKNQSSRFGSCSSRGNLNFNWQIIFFPPEKFRHILLHELTHLKIKNHSKKFWDQLTVYDSDCKFNNLWLKHKGIKYFIF